jgi:hypothetical protein
MPKKTFSTAPKPKPPTDDQISAYEQGGAGHDRPVDGDAGERPTEPMKRLSLDLPASMHTRFKTACSATGRKMGAEIQDFIEQRIKQLEEEGGIFRK